MVGAGRSPRLTSLLSDNKIANVMTTNSYLEEAPADIITIIFGKLGSWSATELCRMKLVSRTLKMHAENKYVLQMALMDDFQTYPWQPMTPTKLKFYHECLQVNNFDHMCCRAVVAFFSNDDLQSALRLLRTGSNVGHHQSIYTAGIILLFGGELELVTKEIQEFQRLFTDPLRSPENIVEHRTKFLAQLSLVWLDNPLDTQIYRGTQICKHHNWNYGWVKTKPQGCGACRAETKLMHIFGY